MDWRNIVYNKNMTTGIYTRTIEYRKIMSRAMTGKHHSITTKKKCSESKMGEKNPNFGIHWTDEEKQQRRTAMLGNKNCLGVKATKEARQKISLSLLGNKRSLGFKQTEETIKKRKKENNYGWISDRTQLKKSEDRRTTAYSEWAIIVKERDGWKCRIADAHCNKKMIAHHILDWINYPELRYIINNGITLCAFHHPRGREKEKRMIPIFQELLSVSKNQNL